MNSAVQWKRRVPGRLYNSYRDLKMGALLTCSSRSNENSMARAEWMGSGQAQMRMVGIWSKRKRDGADRVGIMRTLAFTLSGGLTRTDKDAGGKWVEKQQLYLSIGLCI